MSSSENIQEPPGYWRRLAAALPMRAALVAVAVVWLLGCVWSYQEQSEFAASKGFLFPHLLPLVIDGFAASMAGVAWAASLDARPAVAARLATLAAVAASSVSNGAWAWLRTGHDLATVALGVAVPIAANLAFEVLLAELRRQVQRRRGLPPPVAVPYPRLIRLVLSPWKTFMSWRSLVLDLTAIEHATARTGQPATVTATATVVTESAPVRERPALPPGQPARRRKGKKSGPRLLRQDYLEIARAQLTPGVEPTPSWCQRVTGCGKTLGVDLAKELRAEHSRLTPVPDAPATTENAKENAA